VGYKREKENSAFLGEEISSRCFIVGYKRKENSVGNNISFFVVEERNLATLKGSVDTVFSQPSVFIITLSYFINVIKNEFSKVKIIILKVPLIVYRGISCFRRKF
jgi:hypothetical protein